MGTCGDQTSVSSRLFFSPLLAPNGRARPARNAVRLYGVEPFRVDLQADPARGSAASRAGRCAPRRGRVACRRSAPWIPPPAASRQPRVGGGVLQARAFRALRVHTRRKPRSSERALLPRHTHPALAESPTKRAASSTALRRVPTALSGSYSRSAQGPEHVSERPARRRAASPPPRRTPCRRSALPRQAALATPPATGRSPLAVGGRPKDRLLSFTEREDSSERLGETREHHRGSPPSVERFERPSMCQRSAARANFPRARLTGVRPTKTRAGARKDDHPPNRQAPIVACVLSSPQR